MKINFVSLVLMLVLLSSCGMSNVKIPQNMQEMREFSIKSKLKSVNSYIVKRKFAFIVRDVKKQAKKCLAVQIRQRGYSKSPGYAIGQFHNLTINYIPTVRVAKNKLELSLQMNYGNDMSKPSPGWPKGPAKGFYLLVVDVDRITKHKSKVTVYGSGRFVENLTPPINAWIRANSKGCPNMRKLHKKPKKV